MTLLERLTWPVRLAWALLVLAFYDPDPDSPTIRIRPCQVLGCRWEGTRCRRCGRDMSMVRDYRLVQPRQENP